MFTYVFNENVSNAIRIIGVRIGCLLEFGCKRHVQSMYFFDIGKQAGGSVFGHRYVGIVIGTIM